MSRVEGQLINAVIQLSRFLPDRQFFKPKRDSACFIVDHTVTKSEKAERSFSTLDFIYSFSSPS
jgi:hypothetical protein